MTIRVSLLLYIPFSHLATFVVLSRQELLRGQDFSPPHIHTISQEELFTSRLA